MSKHRRRKPTDLEKKLAKSVKKTGMFAVGQNRNAKWRVAEMERRMLLDEPESI